MTSSTKVKCMLLALPTLTALSFVFVFLRLFSKYRYHRRFACDDHTLVLAWLSLVISLALLMAALPFGYGQHIADIEPKRVEAVRLVASSEAFALFAVALGKTSIGLTLLRIAERVHRRWTQVVIWALTASADIITVAAAVFLWVAIWKGVLVAQCEAWRRIETFHVFAAVWSMMTDFAFAALPWFIVWDSQMRNPKKVGVAVGMSLGVLGITASIKIAHINCRDFNADITYNSVSLVIWTFAEPAVIIMAASVPSIRLLIEKVYDEVTTRQRLFGRSSLAGGSSLEGIVGRESQSSRPESSPSSIFIGEQANRQAYTATCKGGPVDSSVDLEPVGQGIVRTREYEIKISREENHKGYIRMRGEASLPPKAPFPTERLG